MSVKVVDNYFFNIKNSLLMEDDDKREVAIQLAKQCDPHISGAVALNSSFKLYPLISEYISRQLNTQRLSFQSAVTYGVNLCYLVHYLKKLRTFQRSRLDECLLTVNETTLKQYFNSLRRDGLISPWFSRQILSSQSTLFQSPED